jgi:hypothetical protein
MSWGARLERWREARAESTRPDPGSETREAVAAQPEADPGPARPGSVGRLAVWREILGTGWVALSAALTAIGVAAFQLGWKVPGVGLLVDEGWASLFLALVSLLAGVLEGSHRAVARRQREIEARRQELERLIRTPQRRLALAKYSLYRDAFMCAQLVGFLTMARMDASAMTPETALGIERSWWTGFLERFQRVFGAARFGDVFAHRIGGTFPPPRDQAMAIYVGLADFLNLLAERITEGDLDPGYLDGRDAAPEPKPAAAASADARASDPAPHPRGESENLKI